jgi:hypothetical protein
MVSADPPPEPPDERDTLRLVLERNVAVVVAALRGAGPAPLAALLAARTAAAAIEDATQGLVTEARQAGHTWQEIGQLLSISRQAAQQRFTAPGPDDPAHQSAALGRRAAQIVQQRPDDD